MSDSCVELVTFDQLLRRYPQLEQHRIAPTGGAFCRAERLKGGGAAGTYAMPRPMAPTGDKHFFGFYLTDRRLLLADERLSAGAGRGPGVPDPGSGAGGAVCPASAGGYAHPAKI